MKHCSPVSHLKSISYFFKYGTDEKVSAIDSKIVQLQESGTVYENARGIRYVVACLLNFLKQGLPTSACLIERVADKLIKSLNSCQGKRFKSVLVIQVHSESRTMNTDILMGNQANEY